MKLDRRRVVVAGACLALAAGATGAALAIGGDDNNDEADSSAASRPRTFSRPTAIDNLFLPLARRRRCELRGVEEGTRVRSVRTLLDRTERFEVDGAAVGAAVVEDRDYEDGELVERTLDYFAQADDGTVYYLGEDVDDYEDGRIVSHHGAWRYGRDTDVLGVLMPARPRVGSTWRAEDVPGITVESDRVTAHLRSVRVGRRTYRDVLRVRERIRPERETEYKLYARGTGLVLERPPEGRLELVGCR